MRFLLPALVGAAGVAAACSDGQLAQASLAAPCATSDAGCDDDAVNAPVAVGASFDVAVRPDLGGALAVPLRFRPVDPGVVDLDEGVLRGVGPGLTAVLLLTEGDVVVDVVHVAVQKPERLTLHRSGNDVTVVDERALPERVQLFPGEELTLRLSVWAGAQTLAGDTGESWTVSDPAFVLVDQGFPQERRLRAPAAGTAQLVVTLPTGLRTTVSLEVVE